MSYADRVRKDIQFTSPEGNVFKALWQKNRKPKEKNLGIFNYPKLNGSEVQDLGTTGTRYPITFYFVGINHDKETQRFEKAFLEFGTWEVIHPVDGNLILQPVSINPDINPVENGTYSLIQSEWIEPIKKDTIKSTAELGAKVKRKKIDLNIQSANQFNLTLLSAAEKISAIQSIRKSIVAFQNAMKNIYNKVSAVAAKITAIRNQIESTITAAVMNIAALAGQIQSLVELPGLIQMDIKSKIKAYKEMATGILNLSPDGTDKSSKNIVLVQEIFLSSVSASMADTITTAEYSTRSQVIEVIEDILELYNNIAEGLDSIMNSFANNDFDLQYYSQSESFSSAMILLANMIAYLLRVSFDLKVEKTIRLDQDKSPIRIVIEQYGTLGENDILLDMFISANKLKGNDIFIIPSGREVVVYV
ncbi:MAG TPA: DNA circularization N-terminal domain-containing protein [Ignavibacteriaceae bacterium]|nr:DNA circularization N-terminal domain-containing protein [Ignavibacteriaceae bacterium]